MNFTYIKKMMFIMTLLLLLEGCAVYVRGGYYDQYPHYHYYHNHENWH